MTGGHDEQTLRSLSEALNTSRLAQLLGQLQRTGADLGRSANRRVDAELCLIRLCDESLDDSAAGLNARMARLEELAVIGNVASRKPFSTPTADEEPSAAEQRPTLQGKKEERAPQAAEPAKKKSVLEPEKAPEPALSLPVEETPPPVEKMVPPPPLEEEAPPWDMEPPPLPEEREGHSGKVEPPASVPVREERRPTPPPRPAPPPKPSLPGGFWGDLVTGLRGRIPMGEYSFLSNPAMVRGTTDGSILTLWAQSDFVKSMISKPGIVAIIEKAAQNLPGAPYRVTVTVGAPPAGVDVPGGLPQNVSLAEETEDEGHDKLDDLLALGDEFGDIITTEEE